MRNKILIVIALALIGLVVFVRYSFKSQFSEFKTSISEIEKKGKADIENSNNQKLAFLKQTDTALFRLYSTHFIDSLAYTYRDTTFKFLYLSDNVKMKVPNIGYISCLYKNCLVIHSNDSVNQLINPRILALQKKHIESFDVWYPKLKVHRLLNRQLVESDCPGIDSLYLISYNSDAWNEFDKFLSDYENEKIKADKESKGAEGELQRLISNARSKFKSNVVDLFNGKIESNRGQLIVTSVVPESFRGKLLGDIPFNLTKTIINRQKFDAITDEVFEEQWRYNSLSQGSMPWAYCFGSRNGCGGYDCSQISVLSGGSDVLVTIKDEEGNVCRHAYIKAGTKFKFSIPNGRYQVFFYSGTGWNPNRFMKNTSCGELRGGFVSGERFTKDSYVDIYNQILSYELIEQVNGNLSTQPSSMNEAL